MRSHEKTEIREATLDILFPENGSPLAHLEIPSFIGHLEKVFLEKGHQKLESLGRVNQMGSPNIDKADEPLVLEVLWDLFREGLIIPGRSISEPNFPKFTIHTDYKGKSRNQVK